MISSSSVLVLKRFLHSCNSCMGPHQHLQVGQPNNTGKSHIHTACLYHRWIILSPPFANPQTPRTLLKFSFSQIHHTHAENLPDNQQASLEEGHKNKRPHDTTGLHFPCKPCCRCSAQWARGDKTESVEISAVFYCPVLSSGTSQNYSQMTDLLTLLLRIC